MLNIKKTFKDLKLNTSNKKIIHSLQISRLEDRIKKLEVIIGSEKSILVRGTMFFFYYINLFYSLC